MKSSKKIAFAAAALMLASLIGSTVSAGDYPEDKNLDGSYPDNSVVGTTTGGGDVRSPEKDGIIDAPDVTPDFVVKVPSTEISFTPAALKKMARGGNTYVYSFANGAKLKIDGSTIKNIDPLKLIIRITPDKDNSRVVVELIGEIELGLSAEVYVPKQPLKIAGVDSTKAVLSNDEGEEIGSCASKVPNRGVSFSVSQTGTYYVS